MSERLRRIAGVLGAITLLACSGDAAAVPVPGYPFAYATTDCGPADGPAVTVYLTARALDSLPPAGGHLALTIWVGRDEALGRTFRSSDQPVRGFAAECGPEARCDPAAAWRVTLRGLVRDTLDGSVDLQLGGRAVTGSFRARWMPMRMFCG